MLHYLIKLLFISSDMNEIVYSIRRSNYGLVIVYLLFSMLLILIIIAIDASGLVRTSINTFNISATTEKITVDTTDSVMSSWPVKNIKLTLNCPDEPGDIKEINFSGSIKLKPGVKLSIQRIGLGEFSVEFTNEYNVSSGELYTITQQYFADLSSCAYFRITDIKQRVKNGDTIVLPLSGQITPAPMMKFLSQPDVALLRSGKISIIDKKFLSFISDEFYTIGPFILGLGDSVQLKNSTVANQGFLLIDNNAAMQLVYRARASKAIITRYQTDGIVIQNGFWSRLLHDETINILWLAIIALFSFIRFYIKTFIVKKR